MTALFRVELPCKTNASSIWITELMESLERLSFGDWTKSDKELICNKLCVDVVPETYEIHQPPCWDIEDGTLHIYNTVSDYHTVLHSACALIQAYIKEHVPKHTCLFGYCLIDGSAGFKTYEGGGVYISSDELKIFNGLVEANKYKNKKYEKLAKSFGTFATTGTKKTVWQYSILGTQVKKYETFKPISKDAVVGALIKKYNLSSYADVEVWD